MCPRMMYIWDCFWNTAHPVIENHRIPENTMHAENLALLSTTRHSFANF